MHQQLITLSFVPTPTFLHLHTYTNLGLQHLRTPSGKTEDGYCPKWFYNTFTSVKIHPGCTCEFLEANWQINPKIHIVFKLPTFTSICMQLKRTLKILEHIFSTIIENWLSLKQFSKIIHGLGDPKGLLRQICKKSC